MSRWLIIAVVVLLLAAVTLGLAGPFRNCCGARPEPSRVETAVARRLRSFSMPGKAHDQKNPEPASPEVLQAAMHHFADHCASCHGNDGSGDTEMGHNLYPRSPDMRKQETQQLTDGELYYIIHNGVCWTGMPAWGASDYDPETWQLVGFIRHLPNLTKSELQEMERYNPQSRAEREEQEQEKKFLNGDAPPNNKEKK